MHTLLNITNLLGKGGQGFRDSRGKGRAHSAEGLKENIECPMLNNEF
jgi:hypothetical protein